MRIRPWIGLLTGTALILVAQYRLRSDRELLASNPIEPQRQLPRPSPEQTHDFGTRLTGETVEHTFVLVNSSSIVLEIDKVVASCGCISSDDLPLVVPANGQISVPIGAKLERPSPRFGQHLSVVTKAHGVFRFSLTGEVIRPFPIELSFGTIDPANPETICLSSSNSSRIRCDITGVQYDGHRIGITLASSKADQVMDQFCITVESGQVAGTIDETVRVRIRGNDSFQHEVRIRGYIAHAIETWPRPPLMMGLARPGEILQYAFSLKAFAGKETTLLELNVEPKGCHCAPEASDIPAIIESDLTLLIKCIDLEDFGVVDGLIVATLDVDGQTIRRTIDFRLFRSRLEIGAGNP